MAKIYKEINIIDSNGFTTTSTSYVGDGSQGIVEHDPDWYDQVEGIYFEAEFQLIGGIGGGTAYAKLYNMTDSTDVSGSEVSIYIDILTQYGKARSSDLSGVMTASKEYYVQWKTSNASYTIELLNAKIITIQNGAITKTATHWNMGWLGNQLSTSYAEYSYPKRMLYTSTNYDGTVSFEFHATLYHYQSGETSYAELADGATQKAECTAVSTNPVLAKDTSVSAFTSGNELKVNTKSSTAKLAARIANAHLIILQTGTITKTVSTIQVLCGLETGTSTSYPSSGKIRASWDDDDWAYLSKDTRHETTMHRGASGTVYSKITDVSSSSSSELTSTSISPERKMSSSDVGIYGDNKTVGFMGKQGSSRSNWYVYNSRILVYITSMTVPSDRRIFIT
jgi:hypothetical protein